PPALALAERSSSGWAEHRAWVIASYLFGAVAMATWSVIGQLAVRRLLAASSPVPKRCRDALFELAGAASGRVGLVESPLVSQPCAVGWRRLTIVLPRQLCHGELVPLRFALAHEWSHVRRGHVASWTASGIVGWFYFYQPLFWHLRRQLYRCQDFVADA